MVSLICGIQKSQTNISRGVEWWLPGAGSVAKMGEVDQTVQRFSYARQISSGNLMYNMVTSVKNNIPKVYIKYTFKYYRYW